MNWKSFITISASSPAYVSAVCPRSLGAPASLRLGRRRYHNDCVQVKLHVVVPWNFQKALHILSSNQTPPYLYIKLEKHPLPYKRELYVGACPFVFGFWSLLILPSGLLSHSIFIDNSLIDSGQVFLYVGLPTLMHEFIFTLKLSNKSCSHLCTLLMSLWG